MSFTKYTSSFIPTLPTGIGMRLLILWRFMEPLSEDGDHHLMAVNGRRYAFSPTNAELHYFVAIMSFATVSLSPGTGQRRCRV
jgi:hypothetical protein